MAEWQREAVEFDNLYGKSWEHRIPYFGRVIREGLRRREENALSLAGGMEGKTVLDLGCGVGRFALRAAAEGAIVHGYDISPGAIDIAKEKAREAGLDDRCHFTSTDLASVDFPPADIWYDLGCFQYIPDIVPILKGLTHVPDFFSELPNSGHWQNVPRLFYRRMLKGNPYYTYSEERIRDVFSVLGDVEVQARGLSYWITPVR